MKYKEPTGNKQLAIKTAKSDNQYAIAIDNRHILHVFVLHTFHAVMNSQNPTSFIKR